MVSLGWTGYLRHAHEIFQTAEAMKEAVRAHEELRILGRPTFLFSVTSDEFDIYHVNDFMRLRGWRFNGQQHPNALHMAVTRPQTQPGVADALAADLAEAVEYALRNANEPARSSAIYGGPRWHDPRSRPVHPGRHGRHDGWPADDPRRRLMAACGQRVALAVGLGTTELKVGVVSLEGAVLWSTGFPLRTDLRPDGAAEQDADEWWLPIRKAVAAAFAGGVSAAQIAAVSVKGQWASTVAVDSSGNAVAPCIMWMDTRGGRHTRRRLGGSVSGYAPRALLTWVLRAGGAPSTSGADPVGHILHLEQDRPDVAAATRWYLEPVDFLSMRFTGEALATPAFMTAAWLTDNRRLDRISYDACLIRMAGVDGSKLPPLRPSGSVAVPYATGSPKSSGRPGACRWWPAHRIFTPPPWVRARSRPASATW